MTETSPIGSVANPPADTEGSEDEWRYRTASGKLVPLVEARLVGDDGAVSAVGRREHGGARGARALDRG